MTKLLYFLALIYLIQVESSSHKSSLCPELSLKNGRVRYRQKGRFVKFLCNIGFIIAGEKYSTCHNGAWDSEIPKCVRNNCKKLNPPANGLIYPSHRGAVSNFFCKPDYILRGPNVTYCDGHDWDQKLPTCLQANTKPSLSCDFESDDLCGWNNDVGHDFDWRRANLKTPSGHLGTGPSYDHTKGIGNSGYYMYIEASSRSVNDTARLISPIYDKINVSDVCLEFYYHMYGSSTGQLRAYVKKISANWTLEPSAAVFWRAENHGDRWLRSLHQIGPIDEDFQIIFEGVRGESYFSDIAIDDVKIIKDCLSHFTTESFRETAQTTQSVFSFPVFESCHNRCNKESVTPLPDLIACNCTEDCADYNTCCPDYLSECVVDNWGGDDFETISLYDESTPYSNKISSFVEKETKVTAIMVNLTTTEKLTTTVIPATNISTQPTTTSRNPTTTTEPPTVVITTPSTVTTEKQTTTTRPPRKLFTKARKLFTRARKEEDVKEPKITREPVAVSTPEPINKPQEEKPSINHPANIEPTENPTTPKIVKEYIHETKTPEVIQSKHGFSVKIIIIIVASISTIMFLIVSSIYLGKHCNSFKCGNLNKMKKHYGSDSQSDVRFLTSDEILNFNLATPDDFS